MNIAEQVVKFFDEHNHFHIEYLECDKNYQELPLLIGEIDGDWKHDHLYATHLINEFCEKNGYKIIEHISQEIGESDCDWYRAEHRWLIEKI